MEKRESKEKRETGKERIEGEREFRKRRDSTFKLNETKVNFINQKQNYVELQKKSK